MSPSALVYVARMRGRIRIPSSIKPEKTAFTEATTEEESVLAEVLENQAGLLILIGVAALAVMASLAALLVFQILFD